MTQPTQGKKLHEQMGDQIRAKTHINPKLKYGIQKPK